MNGPENEHEGIRLREFRHADADLVRSASSDPKITLTTTVPSTAGLAEALDYIERQHTRLPSGIGYAFAIARAGDDMAVGYIGLGLRDVEHGRAAIGYWVGPDHRGARYGSRALRAIAKWSDNALEIPRLELYVEPWNEPSVRVAESAGFEREGLLRAWQVVGAERKDMWMYSRLRGDTTSSA